MCYQPESDEDCLSGDNKIITECYCNVEGEGRTPPIHAETNPSTPQRWCYSPARTFHFFYGAGNNSLKSPQQKSREKTYF